MSESGAFDYSGVERVTRENLVVAIIAAQWHGDIVNPMLKDAQEALLEYGISEENIRVYRVPGCYELPQAVHMLRSTVDRKTPITDSFEDAAKSTPDAFLCLGCLIKGGTIHFELISSTVTNQLQSLACSDLHQYVLDDLRLPESEDYPKRHAQKVAYRAVPVINGVLTCSTKEQAIARVDGTYSRKGREFAIATVQMLNLRERIAREM